MADAPDATTPRPVDLVLAQDPAPAAKIALSEGSDPRVVAGALAARRAGIAGIILVGDEAGVRAALATEGGSDGDGIEIHDPATSPLTEDFSAAYHDLRRHKGIDAAAAQTAVQSPLVYAAMLVRQGYADGTVSGAVTTTSDVVRTALQVIGKAQGAAMVSSFFLMYPPEHATGDARAMLYSDCGLVIDPSPEELAAIAASSAASCRALMRQEPKIAMLSFSTKGSARHACVTKVTDALKHLKSSHPDLQADGELQFDAAFMPSVAASKAPGSDVAGHANVMIFPNLDAGNIGYKMTQRLGGYAAIGPILQGLAKPANDLSRGCVAQDVTEMIAVTVLQARA
ncbi:phosphotransacetylase [Roseovarius halotolerans]|uniref:Phosphate acetyltransferase n=1 Tax=Roseovarius halotolerans TaxID=505353 RepID=A0A1X6ZTP3_9RHOB|nr:phosphate acetyltransferase [Roseovarius halotolerans]RKT27793.1 phosphotransacetylase [Roseovarius halotolerans]SLN61352.1 Phosphate acetyltransferase [Roseovarius halotolerans]